MEHRLKTPLSVSDILSLHAGDLVYISGTILTGRDKAHAKISSIGTPRPLEGMALYHCGPLIKDGRVISAGPTTSGRLTRYTSMIVDLGVRAIIGKGGLPNASEILKGKAVYLAYPGGCGAMAAGHLKVIGANFEELGMAEAIWEMEADDFGPMVVAIDAYGRDLYAEVRQSQIASKDP